MSDWTVCKPGPKEGEHGCEGAHLLRRPPAGLAVPGRAVLLSAPRGSVVDARSEVVELRT